MEAVSSNDVLEKDISDEEVKLELEESESIEERLDELLADCLEDYPDDDDSEVAQYAAQIAKGSITDKTRSGHIRIIKAYIVFHMKRVAKWDARSVTKQTPYDIRQFITQKCGSKEKKYEGRKFSTAVSTRAALTMWYRHVRPSESIVEWRVDEKTGVCRGLPTRARAVSEFMIGLEKMKAKAGEISQSARALMMEDMHRLYDICICNENEAERRWGTVRYSAYLLSWLMLLRVDEGLSLRFEDIDIVLNEREYFDTGPRTRKAAQFGVRHKFRLYANDQDPRLCPMRALIRLAKLYGEKIPCTGPLFLRVSSFGAVMQDQPVSTPILSRALTQDLQKLCYKSWQLYGTHSFRRGGCQYRLKIRGWSVDMVAAWGGWSQVEALTMFRYFYSPNDNHEYMIDYDRNDAKRIRPV